MSTILFRPRLRLPAFRAPGCTRRLSTRSDPLRILFCGSDDFSCAALEELVGERGRRGGVVESVDVVVRPGKRIGRGHKEIREVPLKHLASELGLPIHERDNFVGFEVPPSINLIIAVSFGLFVPPRILAGTKYGGLNVHPSFLPDLRGAAPLHHALLQNRTYAGVTLQTLDQHKFDRGLILSQTSRPGIPIPPNCTVPQLTDLVKAPAAKLLLNGLRKGLHVNPVDIRGDDKGVVTYAPRLKKEDQRIIWESSAEEIARRLRVLGPLWSEVAAWGTPSKKRVIVRDAEEAAAPELEEGEWKVVEFWEPAAEGERPGSVKVRFCKERNGAVVVALPSGGALRVKEIVVQGKGVQPAARALAPFVVVQ